MVVDSQIQDYLDMLALEKSPRPYEVGVDEARKMIRQRSNDSSWKPSMILVEDLEVTCPDGTIKMRHYKASEASRLFIVAFHGGGWVTGNLDSADGLARFMAFSCNAEVLSVDYRLAPEHPFPAGLHDAEFSIRWASKELAAGCPLVVAGESAGANFSTVCASGVDDELRSIIAAQILFYPITDCDLTRESFTRVRSATSLSVNDMEWYWNQYVPDASLRSNVQTSPLRTPDLSRAAPAVIVLACNDPLFDEGLAYAEKLTSFDVPVRTLVYEGAVHGFISYPRELLIRDEVLTDVSGALAELLRANANESH